MPELLQRLDDLLSELYSIGCDTDYDYQQKYKVIDMLNEIIEEVKQNV